MKKIINKIKQNENLCKVLKVLKLVLDLVVYGFAIFMLIGLAIGSTYKPKESQAQERQLIPNEVVTPNKQAYKGNGYYVISLGGGIGTDSFMTGFFQEYQKTLGDNENAEFNEYATLTDWAYVSINSSWTYFFSSNEGAVSPLCYYMTWNLGTYTTLENFNDSNRLITSFKFTLTSKNDYSMDTGVKMREIHLKVEPLYNNLTSSTFLDYLIDFYFDYSNNIKYWTIGSVGSNSQSVFFLINKNINNNIMLSICSGDVISYELGYEAGFNEGISSVEHQNNGVFGLISQAFYSIADIFNITLLPGFTIGTLIAIPIVVMVIIVLFKMFRG